MTYEHLLLRIPPELKAQIREYAHQHRQSINQTAIEMLAAWFANSHDLEPVHDGEDTGK